MARRRISLIDSPSGARSWVSASSLDLSFIRQQRYFRSYSRTLPIVFDLIVIKGIFMAGIIVWRHREKEGDESVRGYADGPPCLLALLAAHRGPRSGSCPGAGDARMSLALARAMPACGRARSAPCQRHRAPLAPDIPPKGMDEHPLRVKSASPARRL